MSLQLDYTTGAAVAPDRQPLKHLMRDRRIDPGMKYNPVFGRYGMITGNNSSSDPIDYADSYQIQGKLVWL